jgi:diguanylate cyclase (GGDEF)-like protein
MSSSSHEQDRQQLEPTIDLTSSADLLPLGVLVAAADGSATYANRVWTTLTGQAEDEWSGPGWLDILDSDCRAIDGDALLDAVRSGHTHEADWSISVSSLGRRVLRVTATPETVDGELSKIIIGIADVTDQRSQTAWLSHEATHDPLTGLYNRTQFLQFVGHALDRQARSPERLAAVLFMDVDGLKLTNDRFGHEAGDRLLRAVSSRILAAVRPADVAARYGGDEFVVLCEDLRDEEEANLIGERIAEAARGTGIGDHACSLSIGVAMAVPSLDPVQILHEADRAMYHAKRAAHGHGTGPQRRLAVVPDGNAVVSDRATGVSLIAAAAHEMRSPLSAIAGFAETLRKNRHRMKPEEIDAAIVAVDKQARQLGGLLSELLHLGRWHHREGHPPATPVGLLDAVADALETAPPPDFVAVVVPAQRRDSYPVVIADRPSLARVVVNLLTNAYRYGGGTITISTIEGPTYGQLIVEDDGPGVPSNMIHRLFSPFARGGVPGRTADDGTGLGLALAREIVETYGGRLHHEQVHPTGARFVITLPAS